MCTAFFVFAQAMMAVGSKKRYLLLLAQGTFHAGVPEIESIASALCIPLRMTRTKDFSPICLVDDVKEGEVKKIMACSVMCKAAFELWGFGQTYKELKESILKYPTEYKTPFFSKERTFSIRVKGLGKKVPSKKQRETIDSLEDVLLLEGDVKLENPTDIYNIIEDYTSGEPNVPAMPAGIYFTRFLCDGQRQLMEKYNLKERKLIGNTSMDPMLSFLMANLGQAFTGKLVCDPFVGSGSLLVSAAHFGSHVIGGDISYNILHGRGKSSRKGTKWKQRDETIKNCLAEYGLQNKFVDVLLSDAANHAWRTENVLFDAIITDPPYGIREACMRVGTKKQGEIEIPQLEEGQVHYPEQTAYHLDDVFRDLLTFAACLLVCGGRLVYWLPVYRSDYTPDVVPKHPALKLLYNCEQVLNRHSSRRLIVMEKLVTSSGMEATISENVFAGHNSFRNKYFSKN